jgi:hypothetical protein
MHFSEDELREALRRQDPGESFTKDIMARVARQQAQGPATPNRSSRFRELWFGMKLRPVLAGVLSVALVCVGSLGFLHHRRVQEQRAGETAKQQVFLALRITNAKLNHVFERVTTPQAP